MRPEDLLGDSGDEVSEDKQTAFDLQCFKEFVRSFGLHVKWAEAVGGRDDGMTPWQRLEEETGIPLPYFIAGRRVKRFNLLNLMLGRKLARHPLIEAFEDLEEIAGGRQVAMIFKFAGDQDRKIPGTKMVMTSGHPSGLTGTIVYRASGSLVWVGAYKDWRDWLAEAGVNLGL